MNKILVRWIVLITIIVGGVFSVNIVGKADGSPDYRSYYLIAYQEGVNSKIINSRKVKFSMFQNQCNEEFSKMYVNYLKDGGDESFPEYMKDNYYGQDDPGAGSKSVASTTAISEPDPQNYDHYRTKAIRRGYHMKAGDILVCHNSNSLEGVPGHAAIVNSAGYIMEMPGYKFHTKKNARIVTKKKFFRAHSGGKKYVMVYRMRRHPHVAKKAARYTYYKMLKHHNPTYSIFTMKLYKKSPSYCSKYVYLAYDWGGTKKPVKQWWGGRHMVTPYGLIGNFKNSYKPAAIHRIVAYR